jgi:hypothetical protein
MLLTLAVTSGAPASHAASRVPANPTLDPHMWNRLAAVPSYHIESSLRMTSSTSSPVTVSWTEDVHGKDFHLVMHANTGSSKDAEIFVVKGHYYVGVGGHFTDLGAAGQQVSAPVLAMTIGYWTAFTDNPQKVRYVGRIIANGRHADRFKVNYAAMVPGVPTAGTEATGGSVSYANTVDVDLQTHAPLAVSGTFHGADNKHHVVDFSTRFSLTRIGQVPAVKAPPALTVPGL